MQIRVTAGATPARTANKRDPNLPKYLADFTLIAGTTWNDLKESAMTDDYQQQDWYANLNPEEVELLEALRLAQTNQGNMDTLHPKPYNTGFDMEDIEEEEPSDSDDDLSQQSYTPLSKRQSSRVSFAQEPPVFARQKSRSTKLKK